MQQTFANLPENIVAAIAKILSQHNAQEWIAHAKILHHQYMSRGKQQHQNFINTYSDILAYLALRTPATYAQTVGAFLQIQELIPSWQPKTILDLGSGPGTGIWAAKNTWFSIASATCIDQKKSFLSISKQIADLANFPVDISNLYNDGLKGLQNIDQKYDIVLIANLLNELPPTQIEKVLQETYERCNGVLIIIEPGTPFGSQIVEQSAQYFFEKGFLLAPYINNTFATTSKYWLHFSQRFIRPDFQRRIRQNMRDKSLMASDWEDTKYAYIAISKIQPEKTFWGRCIGSITKHKGFIEVPILTQNKLIVEKVMKRDKARYAFAKKLTWGQIIQNETNIHHHVA